LKESYVEKRIRQWLARNRFAAHGRGTCVDIEARQGRRKLWAIEVKGDPRNPRNVGALRNSFFTALGQLSTASQRFRQCKLALGLGVTRTYEDLVRKYADVLRGMRVSVIFVSATQTKKVSPHRLRPPAGLRHRDGEFGCGSARYSVGKGRLVWVKIGRKRQPDIRKFTVLCRELGIDSKTNSAARELYKYSYELTRRRRG